ncbi:MAG: sugar phosphate isomerase/epimerase [Planctomycetota bacterium]|nr:sugar phosphate isomerase/epimerase [Planctomycetota bacterium]
MSPMKLAYNTNGLAHHRLEDALELCSQLGYGGVAITLDVAHLDPMGCWVKQAERTKKLAKRLELDLAVETGARYLLDPARKHEPNLMARNLSDRNKRVEFYRKCIDVAAHLGAPILSLWSGAAEPGLPDSEEAQYSRLVDGLKPVLEYAAEANVTVCFEPEPGMFIERVDQYHTLKGHGAGALDDLKMTLDVGHCLVTQEITPQQAIEENAGEIAHIHLDDIKDHVHEHIMFGQGELNLPAVFQALEKVAYSGMAAVELSRDSHRGAWAAKEALQSLTAARAQ